MKKMIKNAVIALLMMFVGANSAFAANVAKIGEVGYLTLEAAFAAAEDGDVLMMIQDVTLSQLIVIPAGTALVLDLNGTTVSSSVNSLFQLQSYNLTIKDSSIENTGILSCVNENISGGNAFLVYDNCVYMVPEYTQNSENLKVYEVILNGYSTDAVVYVNIDMSSSSYGKYSYYTYES